MWLILFVLALGVGLMVTLSQVGDQVRLDRDAELARVGKLYSDIATALRRLEREATGEPCSQDFMKAMQRVAFLPDGLNKFLYAPGGKVECSTNRGRFYPPVDLGAPDVKAPLTSDLNIWIDRKFPGLGDVVPVTTIAQLGNFAVVVPLREGFERSAAWLEREAVIVAPDDSVWYVTGTKGLYSKLAADEASGSLAKWLGLRGITCGTPIDFCIASKVHLYEWGLAWLPILVLVLGLAASIALLAAAHVVGWIDRYWSFEARFSRNLKNVVVYYQPILDLRSRTVAGCEVLARWRDLDGTIVSPERFLSIVEKTNRTEEFTRLIADQAYVDLCEHVSASGQLKVSFNVFGRDLENGTVTSFFSKFAADRARFVGFVELLESQEVQFEKEQSAVCKIKECGLKVLIDDFGVGYSSIERAAKLDVDGVKLDRTFAMAPPDSVLERLLLLVIQMVKVSGREVIVEGVETPERLKLMFATRKVDYVQGYAVSPPLPIREFAEFLRNGWQADRAGAPELVGMLPECACEAAPGPESSEPDGKHDNEHDEQHLRVGRG